MAAAHCQRRVFGDKTQERVNHASQNPFAFFFSLYIYSIPETSYPPPTHYQQTAPQKTHETTHAPTQPPKQPPETWDGKNQFWLFTLYDKHELDDLSPKQKAALKTMLKAELEARQ